MASSPLSQTPRSRPRRSFLDIYREDHAALGEAGALRLFEEARRWNLAPILERRGVIVFPHDTVTDCGHQIAAAVNACLESGADRVVAIGVLHALTPEMEAARTRLAAGEDVSQEPLRGIQGPGLDDGRQEWRNDHSLFSWRTLWGLATRGMGKRAPQMVERYPFLAGAQPETLPGYDELARLAEDAVVVATADPFHHGIGYGDPPDVAHAPDAGGLDLARASIVEGNRLLEQGAYWEFIQHCVRARNDARDSHPVFRALRGAMAGNVLDVVASDMTGPYGAPPPTWVAGALVTWEPVSSG